MTTNPSELNYDQSVQLVGDQFEIALNGSDAYLDGVALADMDTGLLDPYLAPEVVEHVSGGVVDERELHVFPDKMVSVVRGRDASANAADSTVYANYVVGGLLPGGLVGGETPSPPGFPSLPAIEGVTVPLDLRGPQWTASMIAKDLCSRVGLACSYEAPDYVMREDFQVNGSVTGAIMSLVEPFSHFEPSKVDIWLDGDVLIVRARSAGAPEDSVSISAHDARVTQLMFRDHFLGYVRVLRLTGSVTGQSTNFVAVDPGSRTTSTVDEMEKDGHIESRIITTETVRILDNAILSSLVETFKWDPVTSTLALSETVETAVDVDDLVLAYPNQIVNQPQEHSRVSITSSFTIDSSGFRTFGPTKKTTFITSYDLTGRKSAEETVEEKWALINLTTGFGWVLKSSETKQYRDSGPGQYMIVSTSYNSRGAPGKTRRTTANGSRPGGPGLSVSRNANDPTTPTSDVVYAVVISTAPGAKDVNITNRNLLDEHLASIAAQASAASGSTETEISFTAAGMPWIRRGQYLTITGLDDELGYDIPIATALVIEARVEYREGEGDGGSSYTTFVRAAYWSKL
jgi:hypothetical protein